MGHGVEDGHVGSRPQGQVELGLDVRLPHQIDAARIDDDQPRSLPQAPLHARGEHRVGVGRIGTDDHHHVGGVHGIEVLRAGRFAQRGLQTVARR